MPQPSELDEIRKQLAELLMLIRLRSYYALCHEPYCPRSKGDDACTCGLDDLLSNPGKAVANALACDLCAQRIPLNAEGAHQYLASSSNGGVILDRCKREG